MIDYLIKFFTVLVAMAAVDVCWTYYFIKIDERKEVGAGIWAVILLLFSAFVTTNYVDDKSLIIAAALGSFFGTYYTVKYKKKKEKNDGPEGLAKSAKNNNPRP